MTDFASLTDSQLDESISSGLAAISDAVNSAKPALIERLCRIITEHAPSAASATLWVPAAPGKQLLSVNLIADASGALLGSEADSRVNASAEGACADITEVFGCESFSVDVLGRRAA